MGDSEIVASIVAGGPDGVAEAYDTYADPLYKYCRSLLSDPGAPGDAADAVQDTFVIAASRLAELADPALLRAWLYAVARNECQWILRSAKPTPALPAAPGTADTAIDITEGGVERAQLRALLTSAARGLNPGEREVLELRLRQGLEVAEVAAVLGLSRNRALALVSRAREQLEACLAALLVSRAGRGDCGQLDSLLDGWTGQLTPVLRRRAVRHIERCATCTNRRVYELRPAVLLGLSAGAAMATAAADSLRLAAGAPAALRAHTLELAAGQHAGSVAHRAAAGGRAGTFGRHGFPVPLRQPAANTGPRPSRRRTAALALAAVGAAAVVAVAFELSAGTPAPLALAGGKPPAARVGVVSSGDPASAAAGRGPSSPARRASQQPAHRRSPTTAAASPAPATTAPAPSPRTTSPATRPAVSLSVLSSGGASIPAGSQLTIGTFGTSIVLEANGGTVNWSVTVSGDSGPGIYIWPRQSGTLAAGATTSLRIAAFGRVSGATLTVYPGGAVYRLKVTGRSQQSS